MTDADKFLAAIIAEPDDDLPRLVFADWLEENGDGDRAEFIRIQCALARGGFANRDIPEAELRAGTLLREHEAAWKIPDIRRSVQTFRRGFVESMQIGAGEFVQLAARIEREAPLIDLWLTAAEYHVAALAAVSWLSRLRSLKFKSDSIGGHLRPLFRPGAFAELRSLTIMGDRLWPESIGTLVTLNASWPKLERLDLSGNPIGDEGFGRLASAPSLAGLRELVLRSDGIDFEDRIHATGIAAFARSGNLSRLHSLNLAGQAIGDAGFRSLVQSANLHSVESLDVSRNGIGEIGSEWAVALIASPNVGRMRELKLAGNTINRLAADELSVWPHLRTGCVVDLRGCAMPANAVRAFQESEFRNQFRIEEELA